MSDIYQIFSASRRCYVIQILADDDQAKHTVRELSREIAAVENEIEKNNATGEPYRNVYNSLSQTHLKKMADNNLINYNNERQYVEPAACLPLHALILHRNQIIYELTNNNGDIK